MKDIQACLAIDLVESASLKFICFKRIIVSKTILVINDEPPLGEGLNIVMPWNKVFVYNVKENFGKKYWNLKLKLIMELIDLVLPP